MLPRLRPWPANPSGPSIGTHRPVRQRWSCTDCPRAAQGPEGLLTRWAALVLTAQDKVSLLSMESKRKLSCMISLKRLHGSLSFCRA